jgi:hypothetical protein
MLEKTPERPALAADDLKRNLTIAHIDKDQGLRHIGLVGDTYTITVSGDDTAGRFCVIDMHIPPGGGPPPHRLSPSRPCQPRLAASSLSPAMDFNTRSGLD